MTDQPIQCAWDGEVLRPTSTFWLNRAKEQWGDGEILMVEARMERSDNSHRHYFAAIKECWDNLPDDKREEFPTTEHLRARALIKAGYHDVVDHLCLSPSDARNIATFMRRVVSPYAVVIAKDGVVRVYTPKSQSMKAMDKATFAASKEKVLAVLADLIGVSTDDLNKNAGAAA